MFTRDAMYVETPTQVVKNETDEKVEALYKLAHMLGDEKPGYGEFIRFYHENGIIVGVNWTAFNFEEGKRHRVARLLERGEDGTWTCKVQVKNNLDDPNGNLVDWPENEKLEFYLEEIPKVLVEWSKLRMQNQSEE